MSQLIVSPDPNCTVYAAYNNYSRYRNKPGFSLSELCASFTCVTQLDCTTNEQEFRSLLSSDEFDFRFTCGVAKPTARISFSEKQQIVCAMCLHYTVLVSLAELEQFRRGLAIQRFDALMESFPDLLRRAFEPSEREVTAEYLQDLFVPIFSPVGSNQRITEEAITMLWIRYLQYLEGETP